MVNDITDEINILNYVFEINTSLQFNQKYCFIIHLIIHLLTPFITADSTHRGKPRFPLNILDCSGENVQVVVSRFDSVDIICISMISRNIMLLKLYGVTCNSALHCKNLSLNSRNPK